MATKLDRRIRVGLAISAFWVVIVVCFVAVEFMTGSTEFFFYPIKVTARTPAVSPVSTNNPFYDLIPQDSVMPLPPVRGFQFPVFGLVMFLPLIIGWIAESNRSSRAKIAQDQKNELPIKWTEELAMFERLTCKGSIGEGPRRLLIVLSAPFFLFLVVPGLLFWLIVRVFLWVNSGYPKREKHPLNVGRLFPDGQVSTHSEHPNDFKFCPFCSERIRRTAKKCRFCAEWLEASSPEREDVSPPIQPNTFGLAASQPAHEHRQTEVESNLTPPLMSTPDSGNYQTSGRKPPTDSVRAETKKEPDPIQVQDPSLGSFRFGLLRFVRGLCGAMFAMQIVGLFPVLTWLQRPSAIDDGMLVILFIKVIAMLLFGGLFFWLRGFINRLHIKTQGRPHPALASNRWAV